MKRRPFLALATAACTTAGCLGSPDSSEVSSGATGGDARADAAVTRMAAADADRSLAVRRVETFEHVVRLNDLGTDPTGRITPFADLSERERRVFERATGGGYETRDLPAWLVRFASATPVVERDGRYYRLEHTLPTYTVTAEAVPESEVSGDIAPYEAYERAVTHDGTMATGLLRIARRERVDLTYVWPDLREFFDAYDAVRYHGDVLDFSVSIDDAGPPYRISAARVAVSDAVDGPVWNASDARKPVRRLVREAARTSGAYGLDRAPDGLLENLRTHEYVRLDGTFYTAYVETGERLPVALSAEFADGRLRLAVRNEHDGELRISTGPPRPFGVLRCRRVGDKGESNGDDADGGGADGDESGDDSETHLLWTDAYADSDHVRTVGRSILTVEDIGLLTTLGPGETVGDSFAVGDLPTGEYAVADSVGVEIGGERSTFRYRVVFAVE